jgi:hypothetical protein
MGWTWGGRYNTMQRVISSCLALAYRSNCSQSGRFLCKQVYSGAVCNTQWSAGAAAGGALDGQLY